jgi:hypothetical protein
MPVREAVSSLPVPEATATGGVARTAQAPRAAPQSLRLRVVAHVDVALQGCALRRLPLLTYKICRIMRAQASAAIWLPGFPATAFRRRPGSLHHFAFKASSRAEVDALHVEPQRIGATRAARRFRPTRPRLTERSKAAVGDVRRNEFVPIDNDPGRAENLSLPSGTALLVLLVL